MLELFHPAFGAFVAMTKTGRMLWTLMDGGEAARFDSRSHALSVLSSLPLGQERDFCQPVRAA